MKIIVEGPDGSGKSTLIARLCEQIPQYLWVLRAATRPKRIEEIYDFTHWAAITNQNLIFDRHPMISERIYGPILRGYSLIPLTWGGIVDRMEVLPESSSVPILIYCRPPRAQIVRQANNGPQMEGVLDHLGDIIQAYDREMGILKNYLRVLTFDGTPKSETDLIETLRGDWK